MTELRSFDGESSLGQLESLRKQAWTGVARIRTSGAFGVVWFVKGNCIHAMVKQGQASIVGWKALEQLSRWRKGAILLEQDALPPERSIRLEQRDVWTRLKAESDTARANAADGEGNSAASSRVQAIQADIVNNFPGVLYLSTTHGRKTTHTGSLNERGRSWVRKCLGAFSDKREVRRLVIEKRKRVLLMSKTGGLQTVVVASGGTDVRDLLSAMADVNKRVSVEPSVDAETERVRWS